MHRNTVSRALVIAALVAPLAAYGTPNGQRSEFDLTAVGHFRRVNATGIAMGKIAQARGSAPVRAYGKMLVRDHTRLDRSLVEYAKQRRIAIPEVSPAVETMDRLSALDGDAFDRELVAATITKLAPNGAQPTNQAR